LDAERRLSREDLERLYQTLGPRLQAYLLRQTGDPAAAADLLQEVFVYLLRSPPAAGSEGEVRAYLYRTAHSRVIDHFRREQRAVRPVHLFAESLTAPVLGPMDMEQSFAELEPRDRTLLWLAYVEEMRHNEIARALGVQTLSVKVLLYRARKRLEKVLRRRGLAPEAAV
jgi:RNA polymerase sigma-70 factor (ECF subfamily)